ncbi:MAG: RIP metalloprotease RseP [Boseongicola sp. SB0662_bin_57]|nr:RIP metalloprotease RseP [Boseongicola sp. SB0662_bin_57]
MEIAALIPSFGNLAFTIAAFLVALSTIIAVHEFGHYIVGRWSGIRAEVFSLGFGPVLASRVDRHGTRWQVAILPLGGFVKFLGDQDAASSPDSEAMASLDAKERRASMHGAPLWARTITVVAGPAFNFALSFVLFAALFMFRGIAADPVTVDDLHPLPDMEAHDLRRGDVILAVNGARVPEAGSFGEISAELEAAPELTYTVLRDGRELDVPGPWLFPPIVSATTPASAAADAGLTRGDVIVSVNGMEIHDFDALRQAVAASDGGSVRLEVWREGRGNRPVNLTPTKFDLPTPDGGFETRWLIGVTGALAFEPAIVTPMPGEALAYGLDQVQFIIRSSLSGVYHMVAGDISTCNLSGPIGIAEVSGQAASQGWFTFVWFIALLSTAIGLINLFPIPVLDGGHLVFHAWEAVTGRPPGDRLTKVLMTGGLMLLLALMVFAIGNDIVCP